MTVRTALPAVALALLVAGCADDPAPVADDPAAAAPTTKSPDKETEGGDPDSETPTTGDAGEERTAAVYYLGDTANAGPRLYREFRRGSGEALDVAVDLLADAPLDPDYRSGWQPGQILGASYDGEVVNVEVDPSVRKRPAGMSEAEAAAAVEQVVYTVQAAVQERAPVQFRTADNPIDQVFGVPTSEPLANGPMLQVLSHMSLTTPEQGATVSGDTLRATGVGNGFEATVGWRILRGDEVVDEGAGIMDGWMGNKLFPFELTVDVSDLQPGDYTFWVTTDDPTGGTEGVGAMTDDKAFTIG